MPKEIKEWKKEFCTILDPKLRDPDEWPSQSVDTFGRLCFFLAKTFPNDETSYVMEDLWEKFKKRKLSYRFDFSPSTQLHLIEEEIDKKKCFFVVLPADFPEQVETDFLSEMQKVVHLASLIYDDFHQRPDDRMLLELRANALEAEFLHTFSELAKGKKPKVKFSLAQKEIMKRFPNGRLSLSQPIRDDFTSRRIWDFYKENRQN